MKNTLLQLIALPAALAILLNVVIVSRSSEKGSKVTAKLESGDEKPATLESDGRLWCLDGGDWSYFCNEKKKKENADIVYGSINFTEAPNEPRHVVFTTPEPDSKEHSCDRTVRGEEELGNLMWDVY